MIQISFLTGMAAVTVAWVLFRLAVYLKTKTVDWKYEGKQILFLINLLVIVRFTFYPFSMVNGQVQPLIFDSATAYPFRVNLVPFMNLLDYDIKKELILNIIGNFAMFIPTGIMTPLIYKNLNGLKRTLLTGVILSLVIEVIQLPFAVRASDVDDLILNTAGCLVGYGILSFARWIKKRRAV